MTDPQTGLPADSLGVDGGYNTFSISNLRLNSSTMRANDSGITARFKPLAVSVQQAQELTAEG